MCRPMLMTVVLVLFLGAEARKLKATVAQGSVVVSGSGSVVSNCEAKNGNTAICDAVAVSDGKNRAVAVSKGFAETANVFVQSVAKAIGELEWEAPEIEAKPLQPEKEDIIPWGMKRVSRSQVKMAKPQKAVSQVEMQRLPKSVLSRHCQQHQWGQPSFEKLVEVSEGYRDKASLVRAGWGDAHAEEENSFEILNLYYDPDEYRGWEMQVQRNLARVNEDRIDYEVLEKLIVCIDKLYEEEGSILVFLPVAERPMSRVLIS
ncbi:hypothetical protein BSKO_10938 [Bryopsis sp. KO-2023]|nr:hypothetical protein BSKO_10938 [Bryopsis sp. KO-2023]